MAPRSRAIPAGEWERNKETIKFLYAEKNLAEVVKEMKTCHGFDATQVKRVHLMVLFWGIRKNLHLEQWQDALEQPENILVTGLMTSSGHVRKQASIQRALRRLKTIPGSAPGQRRVPPPPPSHSHIREASFSTDSSAAQSLPEISMPRLPQQQTNSAERRRDLDGTLSSAESALVHLGEVTAHFHPADSSRPLVSDLDNDSMSFGLSEYMSDLEYQGHTRSFTAAAQDMLWMDFDASLDTNLQMATVTNKNPPGNVPTLQVGSGRLLQNFVDDHYFSGFDWEQTHRRILAIPPAITTSSLNNFDNLSTNLEFLAQARSLESGVSDLWFPPADVDSTNYTISAAGSTEQWLKALPSAKFDKYMHSHNVFFTKSKSSTHQHVGASLSRSFALRSLTNSFYSDSKAMFQCLPDTKSPLQNLGKLLPGESTSIMSEQQMSETRLVRILLFSMMNGFVGLNHIPMEDIMKSMSHISTSKLLLQVLEDGPPFTSRTLGDNMFRAAIEAKDQRTVEILLERKLVNVNDTVCFSENRRYTPVERAASLQAHGLIRALVEAGADVNKTHENGDNPGALRKLLEVATRPRYVDFHQVVATAKPELIETMDFLIRKDSKVGLDLLRAHLNTFKNKEEVARLISRSIQPEDHQNFFKHAVISARSAWLSLICETVGKLDENTAVTIIQNMIELCDRAGCSKCLEAWPNTLEDAAVEGAKRGHFKLVQLLINHVHSTTKLLSGAIRSGKEPLIRFILDFHNKPELDPPAHRLGHVNSLPRYYNALPTTPLAEAVRNENKDMVKLLEDSGALNNLATGDRLEALVLAAAEVGNLTYLDHLLRIASSTSNKYRPHCLAVVLALENGYDEAARLLLSAGAEVTCTESSWGRLVPGADFFGRVLPLGATLRKNRDPALIIAILSADIDHIAYTELDNVDSWFDMSILSNIAFVFPEITRYLDNSGLQLICKRCIEIDEVPVFKTFLESISSVGHYLQSCLATATALGHADMVNLLLQLGANPFDNEVLQAAIPKQTKMLQFLFGEDRKLRTSQKCIGAHILKFVLAERPGNTEALNDLLEKGLVNLTVPELIGINEGLDIRRYEYEEMLTPLGLAIVGVSGYCQTNLVAIDRLLHAGSDPNGVARVRIKGPRVNETALMLAIETGREDVVKLLLKYKANVNKETFLTIKQTPLQFATKLGNLDVVHLLIKAGAVVNGEPAIRSGGTALQFAAISGNCNVAAEILECGGYLHALPSKVNGRWPLEGAAEHGRLDMIEFLWKAKELSLGGAGFQPRQCLRAMDFARSNGHLGCRDLISQLSGISIDTLESEDYGVPWLAY